MSLQTNSAFKHKCSAIPDSQHTCTHRWDQSSRNSGRYGALDNDFTLIVEFDDVILPDKTYGDEWYEIYLTVQP